MTKADNGNAAFGHPGIHPPVTAAQQAPIRFTFFWTASDLWEDRDYVVAVA